MLGCLSSVVHRKTSLVCLILLLTPPPQRVSGAGARAADVRSLKYGGTHHVCKSYCAAFVATDRYQGCMLGCRNYIELSMYRPRVNAKAPTENSDKTTKEDDYDVNRKYVGENDVHKSGNDVMRSKSAKEYNYDDVTAEKKAPTASFERSSRKHRFVRIGKKSDDDETADEYNDGGLEKRIPPGALYGQKRRAKFVRIGRRHHFVRIGKSQATTESETAAQQEDGLAPRVSRKVHFVRIGKQHGHSKPYPATNKRTSARASEGVELPAEDGIERRSRKLHFVRIGKRSSAEEKSRKRRGANEQELRRLQNNMLL